MGYTTNLGHTPEFEIEKAGEDITGNFQDRLTSITVTSFEGGGESDTVVIEIDDRDWNVTAPSIGEGSAVLSIALGYKENALYDMGSFQVDEIHFKWMPKTIVLQGNSLGANTNAKAPAIIAHEGKTLGEIVGSIAQSAGVQAVVDPNLSNIEVPYFNQHCSHQHLLQELERRFNGLAKFEDGHLSFTQRGTGLTASGNSLATFTLSPEDVSEGDIQSNNFNAYSKVRASYIDRNINQQVWVSSTTSGNSNSTTPHMVKTPYPSQAEAQAAADAAMAQLNRGTKQGKITLAKGAPEIRGGMRFTIAGCRAGVDDVYVVRCATHSFKKDTGITTMLDIYTEDAGSDANTSTSETSSTPTSPE